MQQRIKAGLIALYAIATVQFAWCYLWLTRPYVNTELYEQGRAANAVSRARPDDAADALGAPKAPRCAG